MSDFPRCTSCSHEFHGLACTASLWKHAHAVPTTCTCPSAFAPPTERLP